MIKITADYGQDQAYTDYLLTFLPANRTQRADAARGALLKLIEYARRGGNPDRAAYAYAVIIARASR